MGFITRNLAFSRTKSRCKAGAAAGQKLIIWRRVITLTWQKHKFGATKCRQWDFLKISLGWFCQSGCMRCCYAPLARPSRLTSHITRCHPAAARFKWWADGKPTQLSLVSTFAHKDAALRVGIASMLQRTQQHVGGIKKGWN